MYVEKILFFYLIHYRKTNLNETLDFFHNSNVIDIRNCPFDNK